jgi:PKD repeat protein
MTRVTLTRAFILIVAALGAACTVQQTDIPSPTGPSEFALSVSVTASPDSISQDGGSQSLVVISARGPDGAPLPFVEFRLDMVVDGVFQDFGTLSARNVVTGRNGQATAVYTAPPPPHPADGPVRFVSIFATPIGSNHQTAVSFHAEIRLTTPGVILPPADTPTARFIFSPATPAINTPVLFDASSSCAEGETCSSSAGIVSFAWLMGDGTQRSGQRPTHTYDVPGTYNVTLTVTNNRGLSASTTQPVTVGAGTPPTADFVFSPTAPVIGQLVQFNGSASRAAPGRTLVEFNWNWGDGESDEGMLDEHDYQASGTYTVTLTVVDDVGQEATVAKTVTVGTGNPTAAFTVSPQPPVSTGTTLTFDASASTAVSGASIASYTWTFGDGTGDGPNAGATTTKSYGVANTYTVSLTVTDNLGRSATVSQAVRIQ